jgi:tetratricopeptide (TPR) repeat protein
MVCRCVLNRSFRFYKIFLFFVLTLLLMNISLARGQSAPPSVENTEKKAKVQQQEKLWSHAMELFSNGENEDSAKQFLTFYKRYPDNIRGEEALWRSAFLYRGLAVTSSDVYWDKVMELFRSFTIEYPESERLADAYFEIAYAYSQMNYHREAITYYSLYLKRFPLHPKAGKAFFLKAGSMLQIQRFTEAAGVYARLRQSDDPANRLRGEAGEGHIFFAQGKYHDALGIYKRILRHNSSYYINDPEILRFMGIASLRVNNDEEGLENLIHYLNLAGPGQFRADVLFEMAESYFKQGNILAANHFYEQIISEGNKDDKLVLLSLFRLAQKKEDTLPVSEKDKLEELAEKKQDKPFQDVLDKHYTDPLSQDARYELLKRHWERKEFDQAFVIGKAYLRYDTEEDQKKEVHDILGHILEKRVEGLLDQQKYEDVYQLYLDEYPYVKGYQRGRLLFLVGRALESMSLWKEASTVYYRALGLSLAPEEKLDLYFHRAQTYMAGNEILSAQRLLKYLRKIYVTEPAIAEIYFLSGKLRGIQQRQEDAMTFFQMAVESYPEDNRKAEYAENYLRLLFELEKTAEAKMALDRFKTESWLGSEKVIDWLIHLGDAYRDHEKFIQAIEVYQSVLADKQPANSSVLQSVYFHLGDALLMVGEEKDAFFYLEKAITGNDVIIQGLARERLGQARIDKSLAELEPVLQ